MTCSNNCPAYLLALGLGALAQVAHAADANASVRAFAYDVPSGADYTDHSAGGPSSGSGVSRSVSSVAGNASSSAQAAVDPLSGALHEKLTGAVAASKFVANTTGQATAAVGQFVFETDASRLWWDADGTGAQAGVVIADFTGLSTMVASDILLIG